MGSLTIEITPHKIKLFHSQLLNWFNENQRPLPWRENQDPYRIWVSEVMLQQTQVNTVLKYYQNFLDRFPTLETLAVADQEDVLKYWEKMGYYARVRNLQRAAQKVVQDFSGEIPSDYKEFRGLPGVGEYIAAAVLSLAFNQPYAVVDGNVKRVLARRLLIDEPVNQSSAKRKFQNLADQHLEHDLPAIYNQAIMELGALICRPQNPLCVECPVRTGCSAFESGRQSDFPVTVKPKTVPQYHLAAGIIFRENQVLIVKRPISGLLGGLWEFPNEKIQKQEKPAQACLRIIRELVGLNVEINQLLTQVKHAYTHFKIIIDVYRCHFIEGEIELNGLADFRWINFEEFESFPFTGATHKMIPLLKRLAENRM